MALRNSQAGQLGANIVERVVIQELNARWQQVSGHNDDGVDGLIFLQDAAGQLTGQIIFVQVKRWSSSPTAAGYVTLSQGSGQIEARSIQWSKVAGASILVWVNPENDLAYWADLRASSSYHGAAVRVQLRNRFDGRSANRLRRLCGTIAEDNALLSIAATRDHIRVAHPGEPLRQAARRAFFEFGAVQPAAGLSGPVHFSRVGWRHMTRPGRPVSRIYQSLQLVRVAKLLVERVPSIQLLRKLENAERPAEVLGLSARVIFPHRDPAVVRVVLLRQLQLTSCEEKLWFYSVHERRRRRGLMGEHSEVG